MEQNPAASKQGVINLKKTWNGREKPPEIGIDQPILDFQGPQRPAMINWKFRTKKMTPITW